MGFLADTRVQAEARKAAAPPKMRVQVERYKGDRAAQRGIEKIFNFGANAALLYHRRGVCSALPVAGRWWAPAPGQDGACMSNSSAVSGSEYSGW
jgi:hypothetical protein